MCENNENCPEIIKATLEIETLKDELEDIKKDQEKIVEQFDEKIKSNKDYFDSIFNEMKNQINNINLNINSINNESQKFIITTQIQIESIKNEAKVIIDKINEFITNSEKKKDNFNMRFTYPIMVASFLAVAGFIAGKLLK